MVRTGKKSWFDDRTVLVHRAKQRVYRVLSRSWTQAHWAVHNVTHRHAQVVYGDAEFTERSIPLLSNAPNPRNWWSTVKTGFFSASSACHFWWTGEVGWSSLPRCLRRTFTLTTVEILLFFSNRIHVTLVQYSVLYLFGGSNPDGMFSIFCKQVSGEMASKLAKIFRNLVRVRSFSACWRLADVALVPKKSSSSDVGDCSSISITPVL